MSRPAVWSRVPAVARAVARCLSKQLVRVEAAEDFVAAISGPLEALQPDTYSPQVLVVVTAEVAEVRQWLLEARSERFYWGPVLVFVADSEPDEQIIAELESVPAVRVVDIGIPPEELCEHIKHAGAVPEQRQADYLGRAASEMWERLRRLAERPVAIPLAGAISRLQVVLDALRSDERLQPHAEDLEAIISQLGQTAARLSGSSGEGGVGREQAEKIGREIADLSDRIGRIQEALRREPRTEPLVRASSIIHRVHNTLALAANGQRQSGMIETLGDWLQWLKRLGFARFSSAGSLGPPRPFQPADVELFDALRNEAVEKIEAFLSREAQDPTKLAKALRPVLDKYGRDIPKALAKWHRTRLAGRAGAVMPKRLIIIEDQPEWLERIRSELMPLAELYGLDIETAQTAEEGAKLLESKSSALVVLDLELPRNESELAAEVTHPEAGIGLLSKLGPQHHCIVLTGHTDLPGAVRQALTHGVLVRNYVTKDRQWPEQLVTRAKLALGLAEQQVGWPPPSLSVYWFALDSQRAHVVPSYMVQLGGLRLFLPPTAFMLLSRLIRAERPMSARELAEELTIPGGRYRVSDVLRDQDIVGIMGEIRSRIAEEARRRNMEDLEAVARNLFSSVDRPDGTVAYVINGRVISRRRMAEHVIVWEEPLPDELAPRSNGRAKVLVVEDEEEWRNRLMEALRGEFDVVAAATMAEAIRLLEQEQPDLISLDLELPAGSGDEPSTASPAAGVEVLRRAKELRPDVGVAILTHVDWDDELMRSVLEQGVFVGDYIFKNWPNPLARLVSSLRWLREERRRPVIYTDLGEQAETGRRPKLHRVDLTRLEEKKLVVDDVEITLSPTAVQLLRWLALYPNFPVPVEVLCWLRAGGPSGEEHGSEFSETARNAVAQAIKRLRRRIAQALDDTHAGKEVIAQASGCYWLRAAEPLAGLRRP